jgi:hypothetical protein
MLIGFDINNFAYLLSFLFLAFAITWTEQGGAGTEIYVEGILLTNITQIANRSHTDLTDIGTNTHATIDTHLAASAPHGAVSTATANRIIVRDASARAAVADPSASSDIDTKGARDSAISTHAGLATGVHGVGASTVDSVAARDSAISTHAGLATGVHGVGASTVDSVAARDSAISTHAGLTANVHGFDASGNAPAQTHGSAKHSGTIGTWAQIDKTTSNIADITTKSHTSLTDIGTNTHATIDTHLAASAPHSGHVQIGGQLGNTPTSPDVRGLRETGGPTNLTLGAVADGQYLKRSGTDIVGSSGITADPGEGHIFIGIWSPNSIGQGTWALSGGPAGTLFGVIFYNSSGANLDNVSYKLYMAAGTYTMKVISDKSTNRGIVDFDIDTTEIGSIDIYGSATTYNNISTVDNVTITSSGLKTLKVRLDGKNPSSTAYYAGLQAIWFYRTA